MLTLPSFQQLWDNGLTRIQGGAQRAPNRGAPMFTSAGRLISERLGCVRNSWGIRTNMRLNVAALTDSCTEGYKNLLLVIKPVQELLQNFWGTDFVLSWHHHYADVRMALNKLTRMKFAMKTVPKDNAVQTQMLYEEAECWSRLQSSGMTAELEGVYEDQRAMYFVYELCRGGDLQQLLEAHGMLSEIEAAQVVHALLTLVNDCHERGVCFGPPHPGRLGLAQMYPSWPHQMGLDPHPGTLDIKAMDFSSSCRLGAQVPGGGAGAGQVQLAGPGAGGLVGHAGAAGGTTLYMAPEMLEGGVVLPEGDVWGVGVLMYQLLSGELPFCAALTHSLQPHIHPCRDSILASITAHPLHFRAPAWSSVSPEARHLIASMLHLSPAHRIAPDAALRHPWFAALRSLAADSSLNILELRTSPKGEGCQALDPAAAAAKAAAAEPQDSLGGGPSAAGEGEEDALLLAAYEDPLDSLDDFAICEIYEINAVGGLMAAQPLDAAGACCGGAAAIGGRGKEAPAGGAPAAGGLAPDMAELAAAAVASAWQGKGSSGSGSVSGTSLMYRSRLAAQLPDLAGLVRQVLSPATVALVVVASGCCVIMW